MKNYYLPTKTTQTISPTIGSLPVTTHYHDLDPHYTDIYGDPLSRVTTDGVDANNYNLNIYMAPLLAPILTKMGCSNVTPHAGAASLAAAGHSLGQGGSYHHKGGTRMGADSSTSMLNMYQQSWTTSNFFITERAASPFYDNITAGTHMIGPQAYLAVGGHQEVPREPGRARHLHVERSAMKRGKSKQGDLWALPASSL